MMDPQRAHGPLLLGLTGGIGAGKSTVADLFRSRGAGVVDADATAREVVEPGAPALTALAEEFGGGVLTEEGELDRAALAALAFANPERTAALNAIMLPVIGERTAVRLAELSDHHVVVHDVPLLVENGMTARYNLSLLVDVPESIRLTRLTTTRGLDPEDARNRIRAQANDAARRLACDVLLDNSTTTKDLEERFDAVWAERIDPFRRYRASGVPAPRNPIPQIEATDASQEEAGARLLSRIEFAAGAVGIDCSGAFTSTPDGVAITLAVTGGGERSQLSQVLSNVGFAAVQGADATYANTDPGRPASVTLSSS